MSVRVLLGDALAVLRTLPSGSVQCAVTSPPYYGLRSYLPAGHPDKDKEIGQEASVGDYIAKLVLVFREVRRVLRDDGTFWLNLGSSYASGGIDPSPSRRPLHVPACDNDGTERSDFPPPGFSYLDRDDECRDGSRFHHGSSADTRAQQPQFALPFAQTTHDTAHLDDELKPVGSLRSFSLESTTPALFSNVQDVSDLAAPVSEPPPDAATSPPDVLQSYRRGPCTDGISSRASAARSQDNRVSAMACDCGSCGVCWGYLTTKALRFKAKDLILVPHLAAMALQADGWYLRSDIIWHKPSPMPESVTDRPTSAHEHVFLLAKNATYFYDADAIRETASSYGRQRTTGKQPPKGRALQESGTHGTGGDLSINYERTQRNSRNVWTIGTQGFPGAHFATMPPDLAERCIKAGSRVGDTILDPFAGAGTTGLVADRLGRDAVLIDLSDAYGEMQRARITNDAPLFAHVSA